NGETVPDPDVGDQKRSRDQVRPEPGVPAERLGEGRAADPGVVGTRRDVREVESPVRIRLRRLHDAPGRVAQLDGDPPDADLTLLDDAGLAPARFEVAPDAAPDVSRPA